MGILAQGKQLWRTLFTRTQRRVLGLFFGHPERSFYANEVVRLADVGTGSVQRELARLAAAGVLTVKRIGNQRHYQANRDCLFYPELRSMVIKGYGAAGALRTAVLNLGGDVEAAFIFGGVEDRTGPDSASLDLMVIARSLKREDAERVMRAAAARIGRKIRLTLVSPKRYRRLREAGDERLMAVLAKPRTMLVGDPRTLDPFHSNR